MDNSLKWQRVRFMPNIPLGKDRQYVTGSQEHIDLSRQAAQEGMVLLKNESGILPLLRGQKIAVFGIGQIDYANSDTMIIASVRCIAAVEAPLKAQP